MLLELIGCGWTGIDSVEVGGLLRDMIDSYRNSKETGPSSTPSSTSAELNKHQRVLPLLQFPEGARRALATRTATNEGSDRGPASSDSSTYGPVDDKSATDPFSAAVTAVRPTLASQVSVRSNDYKSNTILRGCWIVAVGKGTIP